MATYKIDGMDDLVELIKKLGDLPQKCVTKAAKSGANIALKFARAKAPYESGYLEKGIVILGEKTRVSGKKVYQIAMDSNMNDVFVKMAKDGKKRYYYPASQEYGFKTRNGGYVPGAHFLSDSIIENTQRIEKETVYVLSRDIDKLFNKG